MLGPEYDEIADTIPDDNSRVYSVEALLGEAVTASGQFATILDLGCGDGRGYDVIRSLLPSARYCGVDIEGSPEVASRQRSDAEFLSYNGVDLPFADESFDAVYSRQVFEHIRHPDRVMSEVCRVLKPGGIFVCSLSYLEPYHSFSIFNFTPYGVFRIVEDNGLKLVQMRPGTEGLAMIFRQLSARKIGGLRLAYPAFELAGRIRGWSARKRNYLKLRFAGHICFVARKP